MRDRTELPNQRFYPARLRQAGFSLLELLTVLVLLGIVAGISTPQLSRLLTGLDFRKQMGTITANLRSIRLEAISSGREIEVRMQENNFLLQSGAGEAEEKNLDLNPESELTINPEIIYFTPQSTATPAILTFTLGSRSRSIALDALTGLPIVE
ncbi:MAG: prepilin-type N-terminal cleavage/methylation domain-containing protein [Pseudomonadota bacterium]